MENILETTYDQKSRLRNGGKSEKGVPKGTPLIDVETISKTFFCVVKFLI